MNCFGELYARIACLEENDSIIEAAQECFGVKIPTEYHPKDCKDDDNVRMMLALFIVQHADSASHLFRVFQKDISRCVWKNYTKLKKHLEFDDVQQEVYLYAMTRVFSSFNFSRDNLARTYISGCLFKFRMNARACNDVSYGFGITEYMDKLVRPENVKYWLYTDECEDPTLIGGRNFGLSGCSLGYFVEALTTLRTNGGYPETLTYNAERHQSGADHTIEQANFIDGNFLTNPDRYDWLGGYYHSAPDSMTNIRENIELFLKVFNRLPPMWKYVFWKKNQGANCRQIACELDCTTSYVSLIHTHCMDFLHKHHDGQVGVPRHISKVDVPDINFTSATEFIENLMV